MRATLTNCDPQALGSRLIGFRERRVDELDVTGRSLNRPGPRQEVFQIRVCEGMLYVCPPEHILAGQPKCVQLMRPYLEQP